MTTLTDILYQLSQDSSQNEETGSCTEGNGWAGRFDGALTDEDIARACVDGDLELPDADDVADWKAAAGFILWEDTQGFKSADSFDTESGLETAWAGAVSDLEPADEDEGADEPTEPEEDDYTLSDERGRLNVCQSGKVLESFREDCDDEVCATDRALAFVREHADKAQFWPNCWVISDHGNAHLTTY
jgi:hypothetical protein